MLVGEGGQVQVGFTILADDELIIDHCPYAAQRVKKESRLGRGFRGGGEEHKVQGRLYIEKVKKDPLCHLPRKGALAS